MPLELTTLTPPSPSTFKSETRDNKSKEKEVAIAAVSSDRGYI